MAVLSGGQLRAAVDKEVVSGRRKWALPGSAQGAAVYIGDQSVSALSLLVTWLSG